MNDYELCVNLWFCFDKETGFINAISGRGYFLTGSDEKKNIVLKELATSDFLNAQWLPIPNRYKTNIIDVDSTKSISFTGVIHTSDIDVLGIKHPCLPPRKFCVLKPQIVRSGLKAIPPCTAFKLSTPELLNSVFTGSPQKPSVAERYRHPCQYRPKSLLLN